MTEKRECDNKMVAAECEFVDWNKARYEEWQPYLTNIRVGIILVLQFWALPLKFGYADQ